MEVKGNSKVKGGTREEQGEDPVTSRSGAGQEGVVVMEQSPSRGQLELGIQAQRWEDAITDAAD